MLEGLKDLFRLINDGSEAFGYSKEEFYEHDYEDFLGVLKKNKMKLTIDPARREPAEALRAELGRRWASQCRRWSRSSGRMS